MKRAQALDTDLVKIVNEIHEGKKPPSLSLKMESYT